MSTEERQLQIVADVDTTGTRSGFNEIGQQADNMAGQVARSGEQAQRAVTNIGAGAGRSAQSVEAAQRNIIGSIQRTTAAMEAGSRSGAEYYEVLARQRGVDPAVLEPYLAQLRAVEAAQAQAGMSTRAYSAAMRNVPAQITDIFTSLQGGMPALTVALQQGGQLRDMFGGIAPAARALSSQLLGMITPYTLVGAAIAAVGVAYYQGSKEQDTFRASIVATGNAAGVTTSQLAGMTKQAAAVVGTQGANAEAIAALVGTGRVAADQLVASSIAAVSAQKYLGLAVADTAKEFADLGKEPLKATLKLNEQYNFLTLSAYKQIKALEDQGRTADAAKVAQAAYADTLSDRSKKLEGSLGTLEQGWNLLGSSAKAAWDRMLDIGRETSLEEKIKAARQRLADAQKGIAAPPAISTVGMAPSLGFGTGQKETANQAQKELDVLLAREDKEKRLAAMEAERNRLSAAGIKWAEDGEQYLTRAQGLQKALNESREKGLAAGESDVEIAKRALAIRAQYTDVVNAGVESQIAAIGRLGAIQEEAAKRARLLFDAQQQVGGAQALDLRVQYAEKAAKFDEDGLLREKARLQQRLSLTVSEVVSEDQRTAQQQKLADMRGQIAVVDEQILTRRAQLSKDLTTLDVQANRASSDSLDRLLAARQADVDALRGQVQAQKDENAVIGMTTREVQAHNTELVEERARRLELDASIADTILGREAEAEKMRESARLMRELNTERNAGVNKKALFEGDLTRATNLLNIMQAVDDGARQAAQGMAESFGSVGKAIGDLTTSLTGYQTRQAAIAAQLAAIKTDPKNDRTKIAQAETAASRASAQAQIKSYGDMAGAAKGFFSENSKGYRAMEVAERTFRAAEMLMSVQSMAARLSEISTVTAARVISQNVEVAGSTTTTTVVTANEGVKSSAYGVTALAAALAAPFPANIPAYATVAAMLAAIGVAVSGGGGGGGKSVSTARQEKQGTGSVLGDKSAKSDSIARALELTASNSNIELSYTAAMAASLRSIDSSIAGLGNLLVRTSGLDGKVDPDKIGSAQALTESVLGNIPLIGGILGNTVGKIVGSIFGGKTTVEDTGVWVPGKMLGTVRDTGLDASKYVDTKKDGGWFSSDKRNTQITALGPEINAQFSQVIIGLANSVNQAASLLGVGGDAFLNNLNAFVVDIGAVSFKGLTGEEIQKQLETVFSKVGDDLARFGVAGLSQFQQVGEGYLETLVRVASNYANLDSILASSGATFGQTGLASISARERLIALAGGIDQLASQQSGFNDNFLTQAERLAPVQKYVTDQLAAMGLQSLDTRDKFKEYALGLASSGALATEAGAQQYTALMALAEAFAKTHAATVDLTKSEQGIADERAELQQKYNELTMTAAQLRGEEAKAIADSNKGLYDLVTALTVLKDAQKDYDAAVSNAEAAMKTAASQYQAFVDNVTSAQAKFDAAAQAIRDQYTKAVDADTKAAAAVQAARDKVTDGYVSATEKVVAAQQKIVDSAVKLNVSLADLVTSLDTTDIAGKSAGEQQAALEAQLAITAAQARAGDSEAGGKIPEIVKSLLTIGKANSTSELDFASLVADVRNTIGSVQAATTARIGDGKASDERTDLEKALAEQERWAQAVRDSGASFTKASDDLLSGYKEAVSAQQTTGVALEYWAKVAQATGISLVQTKSDLATTGDGLIKGFYDAQKALAMAQIELVAANAIKAGLELRQSSALENFVLAIKDVNTTGKAASDAAAALFEAASNKLVAGTAAALQAQQVAKDGMTYWGSVVTSSAAGIAASVQAMATAAQAIAAAQASAAAAQQAASGYASSNERMVRSWYANNSQYQAAGGKTTQTEVDYWLRQLQAMDATTVKRMFALAAARDSGNSTPLDISAFAAGGDHIGGVRLVGERGPEIEVTGPSRIFSANQTREMLRGGSPELLAELRALREEVALMRADQRVGDAANVSATKEQTRLLRDVTDGGTALLTKEATE